MSSDYLACPRRPVPVCFAEQAARIEALAADLLRRDDCDSNRVEQAINLLHRSLEMRRSGMICRGRPCDYLK